MIRQHKARGIFGGTMVLGLVFVVAGAAFACTKYYAKVTATGNGTGNSATTVNGYPDAGFFQWCEDPMGFSGTSDAQREASISGPPSTYAFSGWDTKVDAANPSLTLTVAPSTVCLQGVTGNNRFPTDTDPVAAYKVAISAGYWDETDEGFATDDEDNCHSINATNNGTTGFGTIIDNGTFPIDSNGNGSKAYYAGNSNIEDAGVLRHAVGGANGWNTACVYWPEGVTTIGGTVYWNPANAVNFRSL